jgi:hypothetical protein
MARLPLRPDPAQLSLFVSAEPTACSAPPIEPAGAAQQPRVESVAPTPMAPGAAPADAPAAGALPPAVFRHPQAVHDIALAGHTVGYALRRSRRRSIGFVVGVDGLSVNAPSWVGVRDIEAALREKSNWILVKLREQQERGRRLQSMPRPPLTAHHAVCTSACLPPPRPSRFAMRCKAGCSARRGACSPSAASTSPHNSVFATSA